jgi:hypothetical protein
MGWLFVLDGVRGPLEGGLSAPPTDHRDLGSRSGHTPHSVIGTLLLTLGLGLPEPQIEWSGDEICPGAQVELVAAIGSYLNAETSHPVPVESRVRLVDAGPVGLRLELELLSSTGDETHELVGIDCEQVLDRAAMLIAGAIDPYAYAWPRRVESSEQHHRVVQSPRNRRVAATAPTRKPPTPNPPTSEDGSAPAPVSPEFGPLELGDPVIDRPRPAISGAISVGGTGFVGLFPSAGGGAELEGALERGRLRWQTGVGGWFGGRFRSTEANVGGDLWALAFASGLCAMPGTRRVQVPLCATGGLGFISVRAVGTVDPRSDVRPWAFAGAETRVLLLAREGLAVGLGVGVMAALLRPAWEVPSYVRFTVPPAMGVIRLTFEVRELRRNKKSSALAINSPSKGH